MGGIGVRPSPTPSRSVSARRGFVPAACSPRFVSVSPSGSSAPSRTPSRSVSPSRGFVSVADCSKALPSPSRSMSCERAAATGAGSANATSSVRAARRRPCGRHRFDMISSSWTGAAAAPPSAVRGGRTTAPLRCIVGGTCGPA